MSGKKNRQERKAKEAKRTQRSSGLNWDKVWKVLASVFSFAGSMVAVYELVNYFRSDAKTFYSIIIPGLGIIVWIAILVQLFRKKARMAIFTIVPLNFW